MVDVSLAFHCLSRFVFALDAGPGQVVDIIACMEKAWVVSHVWPWIKGKWVFSKMEHQFSPSC